MKHFFKLISIFFISFISCSSQDYNDFILKYNNYNFNDFRGLFITFRSSDGSERIYVVTDSNGQHPAYFIHYNILNKKITSIDDRLLKKSNTKDYLYREKIENLIKKIDELDFFILGVDNNENVYLNPYQSNTPVVFLRLKEKSKEKLIKKGFIYKHYKDNWYINDALK